MSANRNSCQPGCSGYGSNRQDGRIRGDGGGELQRNNARVSDPIEIPLSAPDKTNLLVMIGARAGRSRASLVAVPQATRARHTKKKKASQGFHPLRSLWVRAGMSVLRSRVMPCPERSAKIEALRLSTVSGGAGSRLCSIIRPLEAQRCTTNPYRNCRRSSSGMKLFCSCLRYVTHTPNMWRRHVREEHSKEESRRRVSNRRARQVW